jgi:hypothetical protein
MSTMGLYNSTPTTGVISTTNTTGLYSNNTNFTTGQVASSVYSVTGGTGVTVNPTTGNVVVSIGQPVGTANNVTFANVTATGNLSNSYFTLANSAGTNGQVLTTDGAGVTTWATPAAVTVSSVTGSGAGISISPTTGAVVVTNTGVTSIVAGTNVSVSSATGAVTVNATDTNTTYNIDASTATGGANLNLTGSDATTDTVKFASGSGITVTRTDANTITINNTAAPGGVTSITGTANQIIASSSTGAITLSTPQSIGTTSNVNFNNITAAGNLSNNYFTLPNATGTNGQILVSNGSTSPAWTTLATGVSSVTGSGAGISVSPTTGAVVVSNTGVTSIVAGTNVSISGATGAVTVNSTNTTYNIDTSPVTGGAELNLNGSDSTTDAVKFASGTGITVSRTDANTITITNSDPGTAGVTSITGTANQIIASSSTGAVTLSTPQDIATTSSPTFNNLTTTGDIAVNGGDITTTQTTATLFNTTATTVNIGGAATLINAGATTGGTFNIRNTSLVIANTAGNIQLAGRSINATAALTTSTTSSNQVVVSLPFASYHNIRYQVNIVSGGNYHSADIAITTNGTTSYITVSNEMWTSTSLTDWDTDISGANVRLLVTPTNAVTTYKAYYTGLN